MRIVRGGFHRGSIACTAGAVGFGADGRARRGYVAEIVGRRWVAGVAGVITANAGIQRRGGGEEGRGGDEGEEGEKRKELHFCFSRWDLRWIL